MSEDNKLAEKIFVNDTEITLEQLREMQLDPNIRLVIVGENRYRKLEKIYG